MRSILVIAVLSLNSWALLDMTGRSMPRRSRLAWGAFIVAAPILGALAWLLPRSLAGEPRRTQ